MTKETNAPAKTEYDFYGQPISKTEEAAWYVGGFAVATAITAGVIWGMTKAIDAVTGTSIDGNRITVKDGDTIVNATRVPETVTLNK